MRRMWGRGRGGGGGMATYTNWEVEWRNEKGRREWKVKKGSEGERIEKEGGEREKE